MSPRTVLVADDDPDLRDILHSILDAAGFSVQEAASGDVALAMIRETPPDLVILDYMMPGMVGPEVCAQIKQDTLLRHIPIIMLTGKQDLQDKIEGISAGADDYVSKPFAPEELMARVQMVLRRAAQDLEANPLTKLPGNESIQREIEQRLDAKAPIAVAYVDLDQFKTFNDHYGFQRGDDVIRQTADVLLKAVKHHGTSKDFVGHIGGDDFILITEEPKADALCKAVVEGFDAMAAKLYDPADRKRGYLVHQDRRGNATKVPLLAISIALVTAKEQPLTHPGQVAAVGAELKALAKQSDRSVFVRERRKPDPPEAPPSPDPGMRR